MNKKTITIIIFTTLIQLINNLAHPVTPELVSSIGHGSFLLGALYAMMSLANFVMSPFWGRISDKYGRKPCLIIATIGYGLSQLGFGFSTTTSVIIVFRLLSGFFVSASFVAGMAYLIDVSDKSKRTKIMALYTALTGFSGTVGYLVGGIIGDKNYHYSFIFQSAMSVITGITILFVLKESLRTPKTKTKSNLFRDLLNYRRTLVPFLLIITMFTSFFATGFNNGFNSYMKFVLDLRPMFIGIIMSVTGLIGLTMNIFIFPFIKRRFNDYHTLIFSVFAIVVTLSLATYFEMRNFNVTIVLLVVFFAFLALYKPLLQSIISEHGHASGEIMGLNNAVTALGNVGGSFYAGAVFAVSINLTFYSLALIVFISFGLLLLKQKKFNIVG